MDKSLLVNLHLCGFALVTHAQALPPLHKQSCFPECQHGVGWGRENCMIFFEKVELFNEDTHKFKKYI